MKIDENELALIGALAGPATKSEQERNQSHTQNIHRDNSEQTDQLSISKLGQLRSELSGLSQEEMSELKAHREDVLESLKSGDFNAAALAESAPQALKDLSAQKGIDLEEALNELKARFEEDGGRFHPMRMRGLRRHHMRGRRAEEEDEEDEEDDLLVSESLTSTQDTAIEEELLKTVEDDDIEE